jgi:hypothetical protein
MELILWHLDYLRAHTLRDPCLILVKIPYTIIRLIIVSRFTFIMFINPKYIYYFVHLLLLLLTYICYVKVILSYLRFNDILILTTPFNTFLLLVSNYSSSLGYIT